MLFMSSIAAKLLARDSTRIGVVYDHYARGLTIQEIASQIGHTNTTNVVENVRVIEAMTLGSPATVDLTDRETAYLLAFINRWSSEMPPEIVSWSKVAAKHLGDLSKYFPQGNIPTDSIVLEVGLFSDSNKPHEDSSSNMISHRPGIYAYSYPSLITASTFRDEDPLIKIGASKDLQKRIINQASKTEVPEDLMLLWTLECESQEEAFLLESNVHALLRLFGHWRKTAESGSEWFQINLVTLQKLTDIILGKTL